MSLSIQQKMQRMAAWTRDSPGRSTPEAGDGMMFSREAGVGIEISSHADRCLMRITGTTRRLIGATALLLLVSGYLGSWPASISVAVAVLIAVVLWVSSPKESELAAHAAAACKGSDLMTAREVAELSGLSVKRVVPALERDGVARADRGGWRARLPVAMDRIRYRRADVARWVNTWREDPEAK